MSRVCVGHEIVFRALRDSTELPTRSATNSVHARDVVMWVCSPQKMKYFRTFVFLSFSVRSDLIVELPFMNASVLCVTVAL